MGTPGNRTYNRGSKISKSGKHLDAALAIRDNESRRMSKQQQRSGCPHRERNKSS